MRTKTSSTYDETSASRKTSAAALLLLSSIACVLPAGAEVNTGYFGNVAIQGYDPVAYFTERRAIRGSEEHSLEWLGAEWRFSSPEHLQAFAATPMKYAPQYGGHCATGLAISGGLTKDIDPEAWAIIDDKLYLNYSKATNKLLTGKEVSIEKADQHWKKHTSGSS